MIDLHVHILPGLDDGPIDWAESLRMCRMAGAAGTKTVTAAPHMYNGVHVVSREDILAGVRELRDRLLEENIALDIAPGAEVYVHGELAGLLQEGKVMTLGDKGRYLLLEVPLDIMPRGLDHYLFSIHLAGVVPILAHPERNFDVQSHPEMLAKLISSGTLLQLTAGSLFGLFGSRAKKCAMKLLKAGMGHLVASDAHDAGSRAPILDEAYHIVKKTIGTEEADEVFVTRPARILAGESLGRLDAPRKVHSGFRLRFGKN